MSLHWFHFLDHVNFQFYHYLLKPLIILYHLNHSSILKHIIILKHCEGHFVNILHYAFKKPWTSITLARSADTNYLQKYSALFSAAQLWATFQPEFLHSNKDDIPPNP